MGDTSIELTDNEGALLALVLRQQPINGYQISRIYEESPVSNFNSSKGIVYPIIRRLRDRGFIMVHAVEGDPRGSEVLVCTDVGREAVRAWIKHMRPAHLLLEDPLRTKVQSLDVLDRNEQVEWLVDTRMRLGEKLSEVTRYSREIDALQSFAHDNAISSIRSRADWLDRILLAVAKA